MDSESLFKNFGSEYDEKVHEDLQRFLGLKVTEKNIYDMFCKILQETGSVIDGCFILNAVSPFNGTDGSPYKFVRGSKEMHAGL